MASDKNKLTAGKAPLAVSALATACLAMASSPGYAGKTWEFGENGQSITLGAGIRTSFNSVEDAAPSGEDRSKHFDVDNIRLYFNAQVYKFIGITFNTDEIFGDGPVDVLDAIVRFDFDPAFNVWMGRMLVPADRIEMNGPFYGISWNQYTQPLYQSDQGGGAGTYGRDDGLTVWGRAGKFQYAVGAFNGTESGSDGGPNQKDNLLYATRLAYNFLNQEENPAYYTSSTYYGSLGNILTVAVSAQMQSDGVGNAQESGDFSGYTADVLSETVFEKIGVMTIEGEIKKFNSDYTPNSTPQIDPTDCFCMFDGDSWFATGAWLFPQEVGPGRFQPYIRYVKNDPSDGSSSNLSELGVNYVISGFNAKVNLNINSGDANITGYKGEDRNGFSVGVQLQI